MSRLDSPSKRDRTGNTGNAWTHVYLRVTFLESNVFSVVYTHTRVYIYSDREYENFCEDISLDRHGSAERRKRRSRKPWRHFRVGTVISRRRNFAFVAFSLLNAFPNR